MVFCHHHHFICFIRFQQESTTETPHKQSSLEAAKYPSSSLQMNLIVSAPVPLSAAAAESSRIVERFADLMDHSCNRGRIDMHLMPLPKPGQSPAVAAVTADSTDEVCRQDSSLFGSSTPAAAVDKGCSTPSAATVLVDLDTDNCQSALGMLPAVTTEPPPSAAPGGTPSPQGGGPEELFDLSSVDLAEQQRLLDEAERLQRLKRTLQLRASAKATRKKRRTASTPLKG